MTTTVPGETEQGYDTGYDRIYADFDAPLMQQLRREAFGQDIGQHSWVAVPELRSILDRLALSSFHAVLDLGCGAGGPLAFILRSVGCSGTGLDTSRAALEVARRRASSMGIEKRLRLQQADINQPLPFPDCAFQAVMSLDVILHVRDRREVFREVARVLTRGGRFLFTDATVLTGSISADEIAARSVHGFTQFCPVGFNESVLDAAGFSDILSEDCTAGMLKSATGRLRARNAHRSELEQLEGREYCSRQQHYLETVIALAQRGAVSRIMYLARTGV